MASAQDVANRVPITVALMLATVMTSLDSTIANVALPHMQGSFSASQDQMTWVLTSYIVATAVMVPLSGWLSTRIGRKLMFLISIAGFTVTSMLCGVANSLPEMVIFRLLQGLFGASLIPLSQASMLDIYPREQVGQIMAVWGAATLLGPILGPVIGGWLTDDFSWRWVFYINLPLGVLAFAGVWLFLSDDRGGRARPFDFLGFSALVIFIGGLQLMLDRAPTLDWFASREVWAEAIVSAVGLYVFVVQTLSARQPFFDRALLLDLNFITSNAFGLVTAIILFSAMALMPPMMQGLLGYSVFGAGLAMMPRGIGSFAAMLVVGRLVGRVNTRLLLIIGLCITSFGQFQMSHFDLSMDISPFISSGLCQGFGMGLMFVPLSVLAFATLDTRLRPEATAVYTMTRTLGSSVGISIMQAIFTNRASVAHADLAGAVQPASPALAAGLPSAMNPATAGGLLRLNGEISRQAAMVGYVDVFHLMLILTLMVLPTVFLMRTPRAGRHMTEVVVD